MDRSITLDLRRMRSVFSALTRVQSYVSGLSQYARTLPRAYPLAKVGGTASLAVSFGLLASNATQRRVIEDWERSHPPSAEQWQRLLVTRGYHLDPNGPRPEAQDAQNAELWVHPREIQWGEAHFQAALPTPWKDAPTESLQSGWRAYRAFESRYPAQKNGALPPPPLKNRDPLRLEY